MNMCNQSWLKNVGPGLQQITIIYMYVLYSDIGILYDVYKINYNQLQSEYWITDFNHLNTVKI